MNKEQILVILRAHEAELHSCGVRRAALFGSLARGDESPDDRLHDREIWNTVQVDLPPLLSAVEEELRRLASVTLP